MELLKYINKLNKPDTIKEIIINADILNYNITRETTPVYAMGYSQAIAVMGSKVCTIEFTTKDTKVATLETGQNIQIIIKDFNNTNYDGNMLIKLENIHSINRRVNLNLYDEMEYTIDLMSEDLSVEYV